MKKSLTTGQLTAWADTLRQIAAEGLHYAGNEYDRERYSILQSLAMQMTGFLTNQSVDTLEPLRETFLARMAPMVAGAAAVIDRSGKILLMRRSNNGLWGMPVGG